MQQSAEPRDADHLAHCIQVLDRMETIVRALIATTKETENR